MDVTQNRRLQHAIISRDPFLEDRIAQNDLSGSDAQRVARMAAELAVEHYRRTGSMQTAAVDILFMLAASPHTDLAGAGTDGLFTHLAERLSDAFDPEACRLYDLIFSRIIDASRRHPSGQSIDEALNRFGLKDADSLLNRRQVLINRQPIRFENASDCRKCILLSRVSLGAEIAVTSPVIAKMSEIFPHAEIVLIGHQIFGEIFSGVPRLRVRHCPYPAGNTLFERLGGWLDILAIVEEEVAGLPDDQYLIVDPDSRLTQLGMLPLVRDESRYIFYESRSFHCKGHENISSLTSCWLQQRFGGNEPGPFVQPPASACHYAQTLRTHLVPPNHTLTAVSLGVGGNEKKRLGIAFERLLLQALTHVEHNRVLLFKGVGREESARSEQILAMLARSGKIRIAHIDGDDPGRLPSGDTENNVLAWQGSLAVYCALIAHADFQVGYDSSNQHIAAAAGVPTIGIFADETTPMFVKRWAPHGPGPVRTIQAYGMTDTEAVFPAISGIGPEIEDIDTNDRPRIAACLSRVISLFNELRSAKKPV